MVIADCLKVRSECVKHIQQLLLQIVLLCEAETNSHRAPKHNVQVIHVVIDLDRSTNHAPLCTDPTTPALAPL